MDQETQTQGAPVADSPAPSPASGPMTEATLATVLKKSKAAARASKAASTAPSGRAVDAPTDNGSPADLTEAQGQPAPVGTAVRTDDSTLEEGEELNGQSEEGDEAAPSPRQQKEQRRWDKLTAQLKQKDAELAELRGKVQGQDAKPNTTAPVNGHPQLQGLDSEIRQARFVLEWAEENADGGEIQGEDGSKQEMSASEIRKLKARASANLTDLTARRAAQVQELRAEHGRKRAEADALVATEYPWLKDQDATEYQEAAKFIAAIPAEIRGVMASLPDSNLVLGDLIAGRLARLAKKAQGAAKPPAPRPTPQPGRASSAAPRVSPERKAVASSTAKFESSGRMTDFREVLAQRRRAARTAA